MLLTDFSIKRPVVAIVASLLLVVFGVFAVVKLPIRETPNIDQPIVSVRVIYPGAASDVVETKIIKVIEDQISGIEGIKAINSSARDAMGWVSIEFEIGRNIDAAANDVREQVSRAANRLPPDAEPPIIQKADPDADPIMFVNLTSSTRTAIEVSDYVNRYMKDRVTAIDGVAFAFLGGYRKPSLRVWLDRRALAARGLTVVDVENALRKENIELGAGVLESESRDFTLRTARSYQTPDDFAQLVVTRGANNYLVRLGEVATVEIAPEADNSRFRSNGETAVGIGIVKRPGASTLAVANAVRKEVAIMRGTLPPDLDLQISQDNSVYIAAALREVGFAMIVAAVLVVGVIYLFLGTIRAAIIPTVTVPISLIGTFIIMWPMGFSINILTLLALVLAIGLVVDDAIIMLENIHRRMKRGEPPLLAAFRGARQVGMAVVATTLVLAAAFIPIGLMQGMVGRLFTEFAVAMTAAVLVSMFVALTLTPVMCGKILTNDLDESPVAKKAHDVFERLKAFYRTSLNWGLDRPKAVLGMFAGICAATVVLFLVVPQEFTPPEDRGTVNVMVRAPEGSSIAYTDAQALAATKILDEYVAKGEATRILQMLPMGEAVAGGSTNMGNLIMRLAPWEDRKRSASRIAAELTPRLRGIPGAQLVPQPSAVMGQGHLGGGMNFTIGGSTYEELKVWRDQILPALRQNPRLVAVRSNYNETKPQLRVRIDRNRAADLGVSVNTIAQTMAVMLGSRKVTTFLEKGEEYDVILQGRLEDRHSPNDVTNIYVRSDRTQQLVPLASVVTIEESAGPDSLNRFDRLRSISIMGTPLPGYRTGELVKDVDKIIKEKLPPAARVTWRGDAGEMKDSGALMYLSFGLSLVVVFLVLAAQFESFIHPFIILMTVPLAVAGALGGLLLFGGSFNIYSQIGIIVLIGLAAKNGILIVEFANQLRDSGYAFRDALVEAATIRLRPIIMTALATVMGSVPLVLATGAGAEGRQAIGVVIFTGVTFASFITLLVIPVFYSLLAKRTSSPGTIAAKLADYEKQFVRPTPPGASQPAE